jgi:hypothetical protein
VTWPPWRRKKTSDQQPLRLVDVDDAMRRHPWRWMASRIWYRITRTPIGYLIGRTTTASFHMFMSSLLTGIFILLTNSMVLHLNTPIPWLQQLASILMITLLPLLGCMIILALCGVAIRMTPQVVFTTIVNGRRLYLTTVSSSEDQQPSALLKDMHHEQLVMIDDAFQSGRGRCHRILTRRAR